MSVPNDRKLIAALLQESGYADRIGQYVDQLDRIIDENDQLSKTVKSIYEKSDFGRSGRIAKSRLKDEMAIMYMFFEHVYFASDEFIDSALKG